MSLFLLTCSDFSPPKLLMSICLPYFSGVLEPSQQSQTIPPLQQAPTKSPGGAADAQIAMCPYCNFSTISQERMQAHVVQAHGQRPQLRCPLCQESCAIKEQLQKHLIQVHNVTQEGLNRLLVMVDQPDVVMAPPAGSAGNSLPGAPSLPPPPALVPPSSQTGSQPPPLQPQTPMTPSPSTPRATTPVSAAATPPSGALTPIEDIPEVKADLATGEAIKITDDGRFLGRWGYTIIYSEVF